MSAAEEIHSCHHHCPRPECVEQRMREAFEAWVLRNWPTTYLSIAKDGKYITRSVQTMWIGWQAATARECGEVIDALMADHAAHLPPVGSEATQARRLMDQDLMRLCAQAIRERFGLDHE